MTTQQFSITVGNDIGSGATRRIAFNALTDFQQWLTNLPPANDKKASQYLVGARFNSKTNRAASNYADSTLIQLDFDKTQDPDARSNIHAALDLLGVGHVIFDTHSSSQDQHKFVALIPLSRPATREEHAATVRWLLTQLGNYANGIDLEASTNPVQPRFISPNPSQATINGHQRREILLADLPLLQPIAPASVEEHQQQGEAIPEARANREAERKLAIYSDQAPPHVKALFLLALRNNLLSQSRLENYPDWFPVIFATCRAWGITSTQPDEQTQEQQAALEVLEHWSAGHPKFTKKGFRDKLHKWCHGNSQDSDKPLHIQSILTAEIESAKLKDAILRDESLDFDQIQELQEHLITLIGEAPAVAFTADDIANATKQLEAEDAKNASIRKRALNFLSRAPLNCGPRFDQFLELLTETATQGKEELWQQQPDAEWNHFLRPAPILLGLAQAYSMGFAPHVLFRLSDSIQPKALNMYVLNIGNAGTGKSASQNIASSVLSKTVFKHSAPTFKLHSATGLWVNAFEKHGPAQIVMSDEGESLIGKGNLKDVNLANLQTSVKQLFDEGIPGRNFRPSAQVQKELKTLPAPFMHLNLSGTPILLREDLGGGMLNDGFVSRMIVNIDDRPAVEKEEDQAVADLLKLMDNTKEDGSKTTSYEETIDKLATFIQRGWEASGLPGVKQYVACDEFDMDEVEMSGRITAWYEQQGIPPRYITPPKDAAKAKRFAELSVRARQCWKIPPGFAGTNVELNIRSLQVRAENKLHILSSILSLVENPQAIEINVNIMEWCADILFCVQYPFYRHLLTRNINDEQPNKMARINPQFVDQLKAALGEKGPLRQGTCSVSTLREFSRPWRKLLSDWHQPEKTYRRVMAEEILDELGIIIEKAKGKNGFIASYVGASQLDTYDAL